MKTTWPQNRSHKCLYNVQNTETIDITIVNNEMLLTAKTFTWRQNCYHWTTSSLFTVPTYSHQHL